MPVARLLGRGQSRVRQPRGVAPKKRENPCFESTSPSAFSVSRDVWRASSAARVAQEVIDLDAEAAKTPKPKPAAKPGAKPETKADAKADTKAERQDKATAEGDAKKGDAKADAKGDGKGGVDIDLDEGQQTRAGRRSSRGR